MKNKLPNSFFLRRLAAVILLDHGLMRCGRCRMPYPHIKFHSTSFCPCPDEQREAYYLGMARIMYPDTSLNDIHIPSRDQDPCQGCSPLCEPCWSELTPETRLPFYERLMQHWKRDETFQRTKAAAIRAVETGR